MWPSPEEPEQRGALAAKILEICEALEALHNDSKTYGIDASETEQELRSELEALERELFPDGR